MRGPASLLLPIASVVVFTADVAWPFMRGVGTTMAHWPPLARLHARAGHLPVAVALPLFLIPEICSRLGWVVSVWLALQGQPWRGLAVYVGTKLIAGSLALWICSACLPVLLRVRAFAAAHRVIATTQRSAGQWLRGSGGGRFAAAMAQRRAARLTRRSSAATPVTATPSAPVDRSRTG